MKTLQVLVAGALLSLLIISGCRRNENLGSSSMVPKEKVFKMEVINQGAGQVAAHLVLRLLPV